MPEKMYTLFQFYSIINTAHYVAVTTKHTPTPIHQSGEILHEEWTSSVLFSAEFHLHWCIISHDGRETPNFTKFKPSMQQWNHLEVQRKTWM